MFMYIKELQNRITLILIAGLSMLFICYRFKEALLFSVISNTNFSHYCSDFSYFIFTTANEIFYVYFKLLVFITFQLVTLITLHQVFTFISFGLFYSEFTNFRQYVCLATSVWAGFSSVINFFLFPVFIYFFLDFQEFSGFYSIQFFFEPKLTEWLDLYTRFVNSLISYVILLNLFSFAFNILVPECSTPEKLRKLMYYMGAILLIFFSPLELLVQLSCLLIILFFYELWVLHYLLKYTFIKYLGRNSNTLK